MSYEHYFLADAGGKVVTHKPSNLLITTQQVHDAVGGSSGGQGARSAFSIAIKTSEDKLKRRLNKTAALNECFICSDNDPAYIQRKKQMEAAAAAAALLEPEEDEEGGEGGAAAPSRPTAAQLAARQDYIGSKELFTSHPGGGILCLRLRAAEGATVPASLQKKGKAAQEDLQSQDGGFIYSVETKGGRSAGRQKQRYMLLQRGCIYALLVPPDLLVTKIETRDKHGEVTPVRHWASTPAAHLRGVANAAAAMNKLANGAAAAAAAAAATIAATQAMLSAPFTASQLFTQPVTASSLLSYTAASMSPFSSSSISPSAIGGRPFVPPSNVSAPMLQGISPVNGAPMPLFPQSHLVQQHHQQQQALFASTMASLANFPSPSSHLTLQGRHSMRNPLAAMLPPPQHSNQLSPTNMLAMAMGMQNANGMINGYGNVAPMSMGMPGMGAGLPFHPGSNPASNRSSTALSGFSNSGSAIMTPMGANSPILTPGATAAALMTSGIPGGNMASPQSAHLAAAGILGNGAKSPQQMQEEIQQLQALVQMQQAQLNSAQQGANHTPMHTGQFSFDSSPNGMGQLSAGRPPQPRGNSKFDFAVPQQQHQQQQQAAAAAVSELIAQQPPAAAAVSAHAGASTVRSLAASPVAPAYSLLKLEQPSGVAMSGRVTPPPFTSAHANQPHSPFGSARNAMRGHRSPITVKAESQAAGHTASDAHILSHMESPHLMQSDSSGALNSAYWNPPAPVPPPSSLLHPTTSTHSSLDLPAVSSPDFLSSDFHDSTTSMLLHSGLDVPASFFASPLVHESSADSSNASHASKSQDHSPANDPLRLQAMGVPQLHHVTANMSRSSSVDSLQQASTLAAALRPPAFPLLGGGPASAGSSESAASSSLRRAQKRKGPSSNKKRRGGRGNSSASSSVMSDDAGGFGSSSLRKGFSLSPRQWTLALKKPPFRATLSVQRSSSEKFKSSDRVQVKFGGEFLDSSRVDVYKRQLLIDIPPPPSSASLLHASGVSSVALCDGLNALPRSNMEVDMELHVNGALKFTTTFVYKLGAPHVRSTPAGDATTSDSSDDDDDSDSDEGGNSDEDGDGGKRPSSGSSAPGSPDRDGGQDDSNKRHKPDSNQQGGSGGSGGPSSFNYPLHYQAVRLTADFDSIPLFARGVLKSFPLLSQGLQDLLQTYLMTHVRGADDGAAGQESLMIAEEVEEPSPTTAAATAAAAVADSTSQLPVRSKRHSTGSRVLDELASSGVEAFGGKPRALSFEERRASGGPLGQSHSVPDTPGSRSPFRSSVRPSAHRASPISSTARAAARIMFVQAVTSQQPLTFVQTALSAAVQAAAAPASSSSLWQHDSINAVDSFGFSLLHYAVAVGSPQLVELLLSLGANPALQARSTHATHAFSPMQLLQLRQAHEQRREERRAARATARASLLSAASGNLTPPSVGSLSSSPVLDEPSRRPRRQSHRDKKRRTSGEGAERMSSPTAGSPHRSATSSVSQNEQDQHSSSEDSLMADPSSPAGSHAIGLASPSLAPHQPLVLGFSSLRSLGPTPVVSATNSTASTPTNATARLHLGTSSPVATSKEGAASMQNANVTPGSVSKPKSFHFGVVEKSTPAPAEKLLQASNYQLQQQQQQQLHQQTTLQVHHMHHQHLHVPALDKLHTTCNSSGSTATTAAPTPNSHWGSVQPSPQVGAWQPPPLSFSPRSASSSVRVNSSPSTSPVPISSPVQRPANVTSASAGVLNRQMAAIFHAHALTPQGLALTATEATRAPVKEEVAQEPDAESLANAAALQKAIKRSPPLHALLQHRWKLARMKKDVLVASHPARASPLTQSDEERDLQRELVTLELAMLLQHTQKQLTALPLPVPAPPVSSSSSSEAPLLSSPLQSLHIHALRSMLSQFHLLKVYYLAYKKHQTESAQLSNLVAGIQLSDAKQQEDAAGTMHAADMAAMESIHEMADSSSHEGAAATTASDEDVRSLLLHVGTLESALRDRVVFMQRTLAPYMQRALLNNKMQRERERAQAKVAALSSLRRSSSLVAPPPTAASRPLSAGHLSRTNSGVLSLNIVGSIHPDQEDDESAAIRVREIHGVELNRNGESGARRVDLVVHPALEEEESAANFVRHSARRQHVRTPSTTGDVVALASSRLQSPPGTTRQVNPRRSTGTFVAPFSSPAQSVSSTPLGSQGKRSFSFAPSSATGTPVIRSPVLSALGSSSSAAAAASFPSTGSKFALLIALNEYDASLGLPPLRGCENDVSRIGVAISSKFGFAEPRRAEEQSVVFSAQSRSHMLLHAHATRDAVRRALMSLVSAAISPFDSVLIYFAGHGRSNGLMLFDGLFSFAELTQLLADIATKDVTFVSDTCATDAPPVEAAAPHSMTLEQMQQIAAQSENLAAAEILAGISPAQPAHRRLPAPAAAALPSGSDDAEADVSSDEDMRDVNVARAPVASHHHRRSSSHHNVQYRGLAFAQVEPSEPDSADLLVIPARRARALSATEDAGDDGDEEPRSQSPCAPGTDAADSPFPVIQRLLARRGVGYFARASVSRKDARAKEVRMEDGSWGGAYTTRLCEKLERFSLAAEPDEVEPSSSTARSGRRAEPANPRVVSLASVLFHDEQDGNLSARELASCASSTVASRSHSICVDMSEGMLAAAHHADEIDPSADDDADLSQLLAATTLDGADPTSSASALNSDEDEDDDASASSSDEEDNIDCEANPADGHADPVASPMTEREECDAGQFADEEPSTEPPCIEDMSEPPQSLDRMPVALPVQPLQSGTAQRHPLLQFFLSLLTLLFAVRSPSVVSPEQSSVDELLPASDVSVLSVVTATSSASSLKQQEPHHAPSSADVLTTEAASDSSASSDGAAGSGAHGSRSWRRGTPDSSSSDCDEMPRLEIDGPGKHALPEDAAALAGTTSFN